MGGWPWLLVNDHHRPIRWHLQLATRDEPIALGMKDGEVSEARVANEERTQSIHKLNNRELRPQTLNDNGLHLVVLVVRPRVVLTGHFKGVAWSLSWNSGVPTAPRLPYFNFSFPADALMKNVLF
jgi:hypothetical protein